MKRRSFVKASIIGGSLPAIMQSAALAAENKKGKTAAREYYELRTYTLKNDTQQKLVEDYYQQAAIPAYNKTGAKNIGVFTELKPEGQTRIFVLIPHKSIEDFASAGDKLMADKTYTTAADAYLNAPAAAPAYDRVESTLLLAFKYIPQMVVPANKPRIFELRRYENPSEPATKKKEEMFTQGGEISIFRRTGLQPVFFGESIIGPNLPNITYMVTFDDMDAHDKAWKAFISSDEWNKLKVIPDYTDAKLITKITSTLLTPTAFSQV